MLPHIQMFVDYISQNSNVRWRRAAAAADNLRANGKPIARVAPISLNRNIFTKIPTPVWLRMSDVGVSANRAIRGRSQFLQGGQYGRG
jgi:hypothetical protein